MFPLPQKPLDEWTNWDRHLVNGLFLLMGEIIRLRSEGENVSPLTFDKWTQLVTILANALMMFSISEDEIAVNALQAIMISDTFTGSADDLDILANEDYDDNEPPPDSLDAFSSFLDTLDFD